MCGRQTSLALWQAGEGEGGQRTTEYSSYYSLSVLPPKTQHCYEEGRPGEVASTRMTSAMALPTKDETTLFIEPIPFILHEILVEGAFSPTGNHCPERQTELLDAGHGTEEDSFSR